MTITGSANGSSETIQVIRKIDHRCNTATFSVPVLKPNHVFNLGTDVHLTLLSSYEHPVVTSIDAFSNPSSYCNVRYESRIESGVVGPFPIIMTTSTVPIKYASRTFDWGDTQPNTAHVGVYKFKLKVYFNELPSSERTYGEMELLF